MLALALALALALVLMLALMLARTLSIVAPALRCQHVVVPATSTIFFAFL